MIYNRDLWILGRTWDEYQVGQVPGRAPGGCGQVPGAENSRGGIFPQADILPGDFDGRERAVEALERRAVVGKWVFP